MKILRTAWRVAALLGAVLLAGCMTDGGAPPESSDPPLTADGDWVPFVPTLPDDWPALTSPAENPYTPAKAVLGRRLFRETALSSTGVISCLWCHDPVVAFAFKHGGLGSGVFQRPTRRGPPTLFNVAFSPSLMTDGRAASLEEQALLPLYSPDEMNMTGPEIEARLQADTTYVRMFRQVFGPGPIRMSQVAKALAAYQRTLISYRSAYDRWRQGDSGALSDAAKRGEALFSGKADCAHCHVPPLFTDNRFHNIGLDSVIVDKGRMEVTGLAEDAGKFRTPTLRNIDLTSPYMHDGRFETLEEVVDHYSEGRQGPGSQVAPVHLSPGERLDLIEFMKSLRDPGIFQDPGF